VAVNATTVGVTPCVSVIVPAYNAAKTIVETLESIQRQTFSNLEIIVVDDGSTDDTRKRVDTVRDVRLKTLTYSNGGPSTARNRGVAHARGEFISFIDADDLWTPDKLESQLDALWRNVTAGVAYSWTVIIDQAGQLLFAKEPLYFEGNVYAELLRGYFIASGSNILIRKTCFESAGLFDSELRVGEDWDFCLRVARQWPFVVIPRYQVLYRIHPVSLTEVERADSSAVTVIDKALAGAPADIFSLRSQYIARAKEYIAFLYLSRTMPQGKQRAGRTLCEMIRLYPAMLLRQKTLSLVAAWLFMFFVPHPLGLRSAKALMRLYGRIGMLARLDRKGHEAVTATARTSPVDRKSFSDGHKPDDFRAKP